MVRLVVNVVVDDVVVTDVGVVVGVEVTNGQESPKFSKILRRKIGKTSY